MRTLDLFASLPAVPDVPKWLLFLVGKGKLILIAAVVLLVAASRWHARRRGGLPGPDGHLLSRIDPGRHACRVGAPVRS